MPTIRIGGMSSPRCAGSGEYRLAEIAQRHAVPMLEDLISAARSEQVKDMFANLKIALTAEQASELFDRYIYERYPEISDAEQRRRSSISGRRGSSCSISPRSRRRDPPPPIGRPK